MCKSIRTTWVWALAVTCTSTTALKAWVPTITTIKFLFLCFNLVGEFPSSAEGAPGPPLEILKPCRELNLRHTYTRPASPLSCLPTPTNKFLTTTAKHPWWWQQQQQRETGGKTMIKLNSTNNSSLDFDFKKTEQLKNLGCSSNSYHWPLPTPRNPSPFPKRFCYIGMNAILI